MMLEQFSRQTGIGRYFQFSASQFLSVDSAPIATEPLTIMAWAYRLSSGSGDRVLAFIGDSGTNGDWFSLSIANTHQVQGWHRKNAVPLGTGTATGATTISADEWSCCVARFSSSTLRDVALNGVVDGSETTEMVTDWVNNRCSIGRYGDLTPSSFHNGGLAHVAMWDVALTDGEITELWNNGLGRDPREVASYNLRAYWPLDTEAGLLDVVGSAHMTESSSAPTFSADVPFQRQVGRSRAWVNAIAAPASGNSNLLLLGVG